MTPCETIFPNAPDMPKVHCVPAYAGMTKLGVDDGMPFENDVFLRTQEPRVQSCKITLGSCFRRSTMLFQNVR